MQIGVIGINHKLADLRLREALALCCQRRICYLYSSQSVNGFVVLSTCNRTEIYFSAYDLAQAHTSLLQLMRAEVKVEFEHKLYTYFRLDCFHHLCRVTSGLDSAIIGETEIQGQVKSAYERAMSGYRQPKDIHFLFQKALRIGKKVRSDLQLARGLPDLEHAALSIGKEFFRECCAARVLFVGASDINGKIIAFFRDKGIGDISLCNRTYVNGLAMAKEYGAQLVPWEKRHLWPQYDWVLFGTKAPHFIAGRAQIGNGEVTTPKLIMDLCVPRNVDPHLGKDLLITVMNIDQINGTLRVRKQHLQKLIAAAEEIIATACHSHYHNFLADRQWITVHKTG